MPVVGAVLDKLRGAVETLAKRMRDEVDASAAEQMELEVQVDNLQDHVSSLVQDLDSERRALRSFKAARSVKEDKAQYNQRKQQNNKKQITLWKPKEHCVQFAVVMYAKLELLPPIFELKIILKEP